MRKRGARIKRQARTAPGIVAQSLGNYESGLRMAAEAICGGWASPSNFNDIADTLDLLQLGIALLPSQKADLGAVAVAELALVALQNVRDRHEATGEITADEGEQAAIKFVPEIRDRVLNSADATEGIKSFVERRAAGRVAGEARGQRVEQGAHLSGPRPAPPGP